MVAHLSSGKNEPDNRRSESECKSVSEALNSNRLLSTPTNFSADERHEQTSQERTYQETESVDLAWMNQRMGEEKQTSESQADPEQKVRRNCEDRRNFA